MVEGSVNNVVEEYRTLVCPSCLMYFSNAVSVGYDVVWNNCCVNCGAEGVDVDDHKALAKLGVELHEV